MKKLENNFERVQATLHTQTSPHSSSEIIFCLCHMATSKFRVFAYRSSIKRNFGYTISENPKKYLNWTLSRGQEQYQYRLFSQYVEEGSFKKYLESPFPKLHEEYLDIHAFLGKNNKLLTGYINSYQANKKVLHSFLEVTKDQTKFILDIQKNLIMEKDLYNQIFEPIIYSEITEEEKSFLEKISGNLPIEMYLLFPNQTREPLKKILK